MSLTWKESLFLAFLVPYLIANVAVSWLIYQRQYLQPILARRPEIIIFGNLVGMYMYSVAALNRIVKTVPRTMFVLNQYVAMVFFSIYLVFLGILWFKFEIVNEMVRLKSTAFSGSKFVVGITSGRDVNQPLISPNAWFVARKHWISPKRLGPVFFIICLIEFLPFIYVLLDKPERQETEADMISFAFYSLLIVVFVLLAYKIRNDYDYFSLKRDLYRVGFAIIIAGILWITIVAVPVLDDFNSDDFAISTMVSNLLTWAIFYFSAVSPLWLTYQFRNRRISSISAAKFTTLEEVLCIEAGAQAFEQFLIGEFSVENYVFWRHVEQFVRDVKSEKHSIDYLMHKAHEIFENHIADSAEMEVNISSDTRDHLINQFNELDEMSKSDGSTIAPMVNSLLANLFQESATEIFNVMKKDPFMRFKFSQPFKVLLKKTYLEEKTVQALAEQNLI